ncbi:MAG: diheme cytochrome c [Desulfovibrio sp.]
MKTKHLALALLLAVAVVSVAAYCVADDTSGHGEHRRESKRGKHGNGHAEGPAAQARNAAYEAACGSCHWAYAPQLLPQKSWETMLASLGDHYGSEVPLSEQEKSTVRGYLLGNAADASDMKIGRKVMHSLGGATPTRVVEVPYIQRKHRKLASEVFARKGVGGMANCIACHPGAASLDFDDDSVRIPAQ